MLSAWYTNKFFQVSISFKCQMLPKIEHQDETLEQRKTVQFEENQPGQRESKRIKTENDSDDDWVWDFDLDKVINAYQI